MHGYMPSEIARLVLGYLETTCCPQTVNKMLEESCHLLEYSQLLRNGFQYPTTIEGHHLLEMIRDYYLLTHLDSVEDIPKCLLAELGGAFTLLKRLISTSQKQDARHRFPRQSYMFESRIRKRRTNRKIQASSQLVKLAKKSRLIGNDCLTSSQGGSKSSLTCQRCAGRKIASPRVSAAVQEVESLHKAKPVSTADAGLQTESSNFEVAVKTTLMKDVALQTCEALLANNVVLIDASFQTDSPPVVCPKITISKECQTECERLCSVRTATLCANQERTVFKNGSETCAANSSAILDLSPQSVNRNRPANTSKWSLRKIETLANMSLKCNVETKPLPRNMSPHSQISSTPVTMHPGSPRNMSPCHTVDMTPTHGEESHLPLNCSILVQNPSITKENNEFLNRAKQKNHNRSPENTGDPMSPSNRQQNVSPISPSSPYDHVFSSPSTPRVLKSAASVRRNLLPTLPSVDCAKPGCSKEAEEAWRIISTRTKLMQKINLEKERQCSVPKTPTKDPRTASLTSANTGGGCATSTLTSDSDCSSSSSTAHDSNFSSSTPGSESTTPINSPGFRSTTLVDSESTTSINSPGSRSTTLVETPGGHSSTSIVTPRSHSSTLVDTPGGHSSTSIDTPGSGSTTLINTPGRQSTMLTNTPGRLSASSAGTGSRQSTGMPTSHQKTSATLGSNSLASTVNNLNRKLRTSVTESPAQHDIITPLNSVEPDLPNRYPNTNSPRYALSQKRAAAVPLSTPVKDSTSSYENFFSPKRKSNIPRRRLLSSSNSPVKSAQTPEKQGLLAVANQPDDFIDYNCLLEELINYPPLIEKLTENINQAVSNKDVEQPALVSPTNNEAGGLVQDILTKTESDPVFEEVLNMLYDKHDGNRPAAATISESEVNQEISIICTDVDTRLRTKSLSGEGLKLVQYEDGDSSQCEGDLDATNDQTTICLASQDEGITLYSAQEELNMSRSMDGSVGRNQLDPSTIMNGFSAATFDNSQFGTCITVLDQPIMSTLGGSVSTNYNTVLLNGAAVTPVKIAIPDFHFLTVSPSQLFGVPFTVVDHQKPLNPIGSNLPSQVVISECDSVSSHTETNTPLTPRSRKPLKNYQKSKSATSNLAAPSKPEASIPPMHLAGAASRISSKPPLSVKMQSAEPAINSNDKIFQSMISFQKCRRGPLGVSNKITKAHRPQSTPNSEVFKKKMLSETHVRILDFGTPNVEMPATSKEPTSKKLPSSTTVSELLRRLNRNDDQPTKPTIKKLSKSVGAEKPKETILNGFHKVKSTKTVGPVEDSEESTSLNQFYNLPTRCATSQENPVTKATTENSQNLNLGRKSLESKNKKSFESRKRNSFESKNRKIFESRNKSSSSSRPKNKLGEKSPIKRGLKRKAPDSTKKPDKILQTMDVDKFLAKIHPSKR